MKLIIHIAGKYAFFLPNKKEDLVSVAILSLVECCTEISEGKINNFDGNLTGLLAMRAHSKCGNYIKYDHTLKYKRGDESELKRVNVNTVTLKCQLSYIDLKELINEACLDKRDREIIKLRMQNYTDTEIAERMNLHPSSVARLKRDIETRFENMERELQ